MTFATHLVALWGGIFTLMFGLAFWLAGIANRRTNSFNQTILGATCVTAAIFMFVYAFTGSLPY